MSLEGAIAAHRFGLGARPGEIEAASRSPKAWLMGQLDSAPAQPQALDGQPLQSGAATIPQLLQIRKMTADQRKALQVFKTYVQSYLREMSARFALGFTTERPFAERLVWFWSNHFVVSALNPRDIMLAGAFEREAIRPNINGRFEDMLLAVVRHPAMLLYLDNAQSIGPDSPAGMIAGKGLNENLGRELMELHTLGVDGGYTQADVIAMAKLLTGWSIDPSGNGNGFQYFPRRHEPGAIVLRGKTYPDGEEGGIAALKDLARDPATARHIARKFAVHFIGDDPSSASVDRLQRNFLRTGGDLRALAETAVNDPAAWKPDSGKMRSPVEYVTASMRLVGWPRTTNADDEDKQVKGIMAATRLMGEFPLAAPSPKGWPDESDAWSGPDAVLNRIEWARELGNKLPDGFDAVAVGEEALGPLLHPATRVAMSKAANSGEAIALLIASPEFQRR
ncbi:MAG: DUF1800 domain-containing protein [Rhizomicrobium sp.]